MHTFSTVLVNIMRAAFAVACDDTDLTFPPRWAWLDVNAVQLYDSTLVTVAAQVDQHRVAASFHSANVRWSQLTLC